MQGTDLIERMQDHNWHLDTVHPPRHPVPAQRVGATLVRRPARSEQLHCDTRNFAETGQHEHGLGSAGCEFASVRVRPGKSPTVRIDTYRDHGNVLSDSSARRRRDPDVRCTAAESARSILGGHPRAGAGYSRHPTTNDSGKPLSHELTLSPDAVIVRAHPGHFRMRAYPASMGSESAHGHLERSTRVEQVLLTDASTVTLGEVWNVLSARRPDLLDLVLTGQSPQGRFLAVGAVWVPLSVRHVRR